MKRVSKPGDPDDGIDNSSDGTSVNRRVFLGAAASSVPLALAGCTGDSESETTTQGSDDTGSGSGSGSSDDSTTDQGTPKMGGELQWGGAVPVQGLDPHLESAAASKRVLENIYEELLELQPDFTVEPHLATDMEQSADNTVLTLSLREGVTFHNGTEMTAEDVLASYERVANGEYLASGFFDFVDNMEAPDDYTFVIELNTPFAPFIAKMATAELAIMPAEEASKEKIDKPIGTGPYQFHSREIETSFTMTRFDDYWDAGDHGPYLDTVVKSEIKDPSVRLQSFNAGEYDFINGIAPKDVESVKGSEGVRFETKFPKALVYMGLNCAKAPFDDKHARLALDYAFDKETVTEAALYGTGKPTATPAAPGSLWVNEDIQPRSRDLDKAREHLDKAGLADGFEVSFKIPQSYPTQVQGAKVIADQAADVGIDLNIQKITWSSWLSDVWSNRDFEATTSSYLALTNPDISFHKFLHPEGAFFFTGWDNEEYNALVEEARHIYDDQKRAELYKEATEILHEERAGHLFLWWEANLYGADERYRGDIGAPDGSTLRFKDNWFEN